MEPSAEPAVQQSTDLEALPHAARIEPTSIKPFKTKAPCSHLGNHCQQAFTQASDSAVSEQCHERCAGSEAEVRPQAPTATPQLSAANISVSGLKALLGCHPHGSSESTQAALHDAQLKQNSEADMAAPELQEAARRADEAAAALILEDEREQARRLLREQTRQGKVAAKKAKAQQCKAEPQAQVAKASSSVPSPYQHLPSGRLLM